MGGDFHINSRWNLHLRYFFNDISRPLTTRSDLLVKPLDSAMFLFLEFCMVKDRHPKRGSRPG